MPLSILFKKKEVDVTEIRYIHSIWRRRRDSNPRDAINAYTISSRAPSTKLGDFSMHIMRYLIAPDHSSRCYYIVCSVKKQPFFSFIRTKSACFSAAQRAPQAVPHELHYKADYSITLLPHENISAHQRLLISEITILPSVEEA